MATSKFNLGTLRGMDQELRQRLGESFSISNKNNNWGNQKHAVNGYTDNYGQDSNQMDRTSSYDKQCQDNEASNEASALSVTKLKQLTIEAKSIPANSFYGTNKQQLRDAILWTEVLGEPKCKKRHRK